ncbi:uncharacterized protein PFL1_01327 [Pseudozyma flocculosa PF-1]|uniref:DNA replication complex GINS protein SLD5 n=1 Tax=Pseudozyma flocculosa TaxID=84751 RepID=A0A5C3EY76_9BASI|nr:uncharacterized protein PFL1_01327 [Pseudozyma flocculosa PF-1]EPQ31138.1 hypothetical protein PFL1_01327 [Pseudozyma flocculosa PF-1]SPO36001.1 uncharacterized protein PSFLO_01472 [Pseudozyma flocculosa]
MPPTRYDIDQDIDDLHDLTPPRPPPRGARPSVPPAVALLPDLDALPSSSTDRTSKRTGAPSTPPPPPLAQLTTHWINQRTSPELLPYPTACIATLLSQMDQQQSILDSLSSLPPSDDAQEMEDEHLRLQCVLLDLERARWLLRSYLRARLALIEKYAPFLVRERQRGEGRGRLSNVEWEFCTRYNDLRTSHLQHTVLQFLPEQMRGMDDQALNSSGADSGKGDMVEQPDLDSPVFVRCREECGNLLLPDGETANLSKDSVHFLRYRSVRHLVAQNLVQLI